MFLKLSVKVIKVTVHLNFTPKSVNFVRRFLAFG